MTTHSCTYLIEIDHMLLGSVYLFGTSIMSNCENELSQLLFALPTTCMATGTFVSHTGRVECGGTLKRTMGEYKPRLAKRRTVATFHVVVDDVDGNPLFRTKHCTTNASTRELCCSWWRNSISTYLLRPTHKRSSVLYRQVRNLLCTIMHLVD